MNTREEPAFCASARCPRAAPREVSFFSGCCCVLTWSEMESEMPGVGGGGRARFGAKATEERRKLKGLGRRLKDQSQINRTEELCFYRYPYSNRTDSHTGRLF